MSIVNRRQDACATVNVVRSRCLTFPIERGETPDERFASGDESLLEAREELSNIDWIHTIIKDWCKKFYAEKKLDGSI